jgi:hypothetical protein
MEGRRFGGDANNIATPRERQQKFTAAYKGRAKVKRQKAKVKIRGSAAVINRR